jgi:hypothetical protein
MVCGYICTGALGAGTTPSEAARQGLAEVVFPEPAQRDIAGGRLAGLLAALLQVSDERMRNPEYSFAPILPDDKVGLADRSVALAEWCQGFLYAIGPGLSDWTATSDALQEFVSDMGEIARLEASSDDETDEGAYAELVEYVRAGVMLAYAERPERGSVISGIRAKRAATPLPKSHKVH